MIRMVNVSALAVLLLTLPARKLFGVGRGCAEDLSRDGEGAGGRGVAEGAGRGSAAVCGGDAGAASGEAISEREGAGAGVS